MDKPYNAHVIESLLDNDLYKFTMMQAVYHQFTSAIVEYKFKCRTPNINLAKYANEVSNEIHHLCSLRFQQGELDYMFAMRYM